MKQLFISLILAVCFVACTNEEEDFSLGPSSKMSVQESDECVQEDANQLNSSLLERFKVLTRGEGDGKEEYPRVLRRLCYKRGWNANYTFYR